MRSLPLLVLLALAWAPGSAARAAGDAGAADTDISATRRAVVLRFAGPSADLVRSSVTGVLEDQSSVALIPVRRLEAERDIPGTPKERIIEVGRRLGLSALVRGRVKKVRRAFQLTLTVVNAGDGETLGTLVLQGRTLLLLHAKVRTDLWGRLSPLLEGSTAAPAESPEPVVRKDRAREDEKEKEREQAEAAALTEKALQARDEESDQPSAQPKTKTWAEAETEGKQAERRARVAQPAKAAAAEPPPSPCSIVDVEPAGGVLLRWFNYRDEQRGALRAYTLRRAPIGRIEATLHPFGGERCGVAGALGVRLAYERMAPVTSQLADRRLGTEATAFRGELVVRIRLGALTLTPSAGYFVRQFSVDSRPVPYVDYRSVGGELRAQVQLGPLRLELGAGGRKVLCAVELGGSGRGALCGGAAQIRTWFPQLTGLAYVARARLGVAVTSWLDLLAGADVEYVSLDFNTVDEGSYPNGVAAGAYDIYLQGLLAVRVHTP